ncbi:MAG: rhomboid family intramembrane serine protease [Alphaproteobacteria bacterium]|nr:rhomboid family intramembrane serine protease [Alphaproteobacteria bacterium]MCW5743251.1 rhomboid family intramembrane serine protease [Alphaproteobacteria bacterium]
MPFDHRDFPGAPPPREPAINLPPVTLALIVFMLVLHGLRQLLSDKLDTELIFTFSMIPARFTGAVPTDIESVVLAPLTHMVLHADWLHVGVNVATLAAFGSPVERLLGTWRYVLLFVLAGLIGAALHVAFYPADISPMLGASGAISGLFGALLIVLRAAGRLTAMVPFTILWLALQVGLGLFTTTPSGDTIAWAGHIGGFLAGLLLFVPISRLRI